MDNQLTISQLNPVYFYKKNRSLIPQYHTKHRDEWPAIESRMPWQQYPLGQYFQKWQFNDTIRLQVMSNVAPIFLVLVDCRGRDIYSVQFTQKQRNRYIPDVFIYEVQMALNGVGTIVRGRYKVEIRVGDPILTAETMESDWLDIAEDWPRTTLWEYASSFYYADAIFATGWAPSFRVEGWFKMEAPGSEDQVYVDQVLNQRIVYSDPFEVEDYIMGPGSGVPDWTPAKMIWILGCDELYGDGKAFTKPEGAKFTEEELEGYLYRGWSINLRPTNRRSSRIFPIDPSVGGKKLLVAMNVETQGFADTTIGSSSTVIGIASVE